MKRFFIPFVLLGALVSLTGCPDGTPGKETVRNSWEDMMDELKKMDEASMKKHWKRYYQRAIADLNGKVKDLTDKKIELKTNLKLKEKELDEKAATAGKAKALIKGAIAKYKQGVKDGAETISISDDPAASNMSPDEAKQQIKKWTNEFKRKYSDKKIDTLTNIVKKLKASVGKLDIAIEAYKDKAEQLEEQMQTYEAELELAKVRESMNALCATGTELEGHTGEPSLDQLTSLNKSLDKAIAKSEVEAEMIQEEKELKAKFSSLDEAVSSVGSELSVDDLEKEISEIQ
tara:strand:- start:1 stop:867 length:867 start_codon:yes stop_codon:yes gene_type:complete